MDSLRCQYASKPCTNARTLKTNGQPHTLCELHRTRAINAQRRWYVRKSTQRAPPTSRMAVSRRPPVDTKEWMAAALVPKPATTSKKIPSDDNGATQKRRGRVTFRNSTNITKLLLPTPQYGDVNDRSSMASPFSYHDPLAGWASAENDCKMLDHAEQLTTDELTRLLDQMSATERDVAPLESQTDTSFEAVAMYPIGSDPPTRATHQQH